MRMKNDNLFWLSALSLAVLIAGCGRVEDGPQRYKVSGTVTYDGEPVPKGFIMLSPDTSKGNKGPGSGAKIVDGKFETQDGKGTVGGWHKVRITGSDGIPTTENGEELPDGKQLFPAYETEIELPKEDSEQSFEVPADES